MKSQLLDVKHDLSKVPEVVRLSLQSAIRADFAAFESSLLAKLIPATESKPPLTTTVMVEKAAFTFRPPNARSPPRAALDFSTPRDSPALKKTARDLMSDDRL